MNRVTTLVAGLAALTVVSTAAEAAQGCGKGYHFNGQRCVPQGTDARQPYRKGSSADLRDTGYRSHHPLRGSSAGLGDTGYRSHHPLRGSSADVGYGHRPTHRGHGISVDLGPIGRLHFHHGGSHHED
jgi:hypothetical protein